MGQAALACQTACPAGVQYVPILEAARASAEDAGLLDTPMRGVYRWLSLKVLMTRPWLMRLVARAIALQQKPSIRQTLYKIGLMRLSPPNLRELEPKAPLMDPPFSDQRIAEVERPPAEWWQGPPRARVAVLSGCVQDIAFARVNRATVDVLLAAGCEVVTPRNQPCCGSLHAHNGEVDTAKQMARRTLDPFRTAAAHPLDGFDAVISNSGGCGSHLRHYGDLLADDPTYGALAHQWDAKVRDVQEFVWELVGPGEPSGGSRLDHVLSQQASDQAAEGKRLTYDASCHLCHGQKVVTQPVELLKRLPDHRFVPLAESDWCCGAAGVYTMTQPEQAGKLLERKLEQPARGAAGRGRHGEPGVHAPALSMACASRPRSSATGCASRTRWSCIAERLASRAWNAVKPRPRRAARLSRPLRARRSCGRERLRLGGGALHSLVRVSKTSGVS